MSSHTPSLGHQKTQWQRSGFGNVEPQSFSWNEKLTDPSSLPKPADTAYKAAQAVSVQTGAYNAKKLPQPPKAAPVPEVTKDLLDARLEAIEARMDSRVAGMSAKLDATLAEIRADRVRFENLDRSVATINSDLKQSSQRFENQLAASATQVDSRVSGLKTNIWFGVATTITAVGASLAIAIASFDSGRETSKNISEATARMEKIQTQLEAAAKAQAAAASTPKN